VNDKKKHDVYVLVKPVNGAESGATAILGVELKN
jgi:hypothetical protein